MMHMLVTNLDQWWQTISALDLTSRYQARVAYAVDPSGVLWHFAEERAPTSRMTGVVAPPLPRVADSGTNLRFTSQA
jgi:hypothetical protein